MELLKLLNDNGIAASVAKAEKLERYMELVLDRNRELNLTAITDKEEFAVKHIVDSLIIVDMEEFIEADSVVDVGTGAGFPGVPLAIMAEKKKFTLLDSLDKRLKVIDEFCSELGIDNVKTCHMRAEDAGKGPLREKFPLCVSRAVADMRVLAEYTLPLIKVGGSAIYYKGPEPEEEIEAAEIGIETLGGSIAGLEEAEIEGNRRTLLIVDKVDETPSKYPRKAGKPEKDPL